MRPEVRRSHLLSTYVRSHERELVLDAAAQERVTQSELIRTAVLEHARQILSLVGVGTVSGTVPESGIPPHARPVGPRTRKGAARAASSQAWPNPTPSPALTRP